MSAVQNVGSYLKSHLTLSEETKEQIQQTVIKIKDFIVEHKSLIFFGLSVIFSYYMAPASAFEYLSYMGYSLKEVLVEGILWGTTILMLKNLFGAKPLTKAHDDKINYLAAIANIGQTYLCPTSGLFSSVASAGFIGIKTAFHHIFASDERRIYFMMDNDTN